METTILVTGATDGIGLETARMLAEGGHNVLMHGRNPAKLARAAQLVGRNGGTYVADLSQLAEVEALAKAITGQHHKLDVLINNAGIYKTSQPVTPDGLDVRFMVNTIAPFALTTALLPIIGQDGRVINLSSAAQAPVDLAALSGKRRLADMDAYAQSKLAITMWTKALAETMPGGPTFVAVNPGSLLASKMVKEGFGVEGKDLRIGASILCRAALSDDFAGASGAYFDNDSGRFANPNADASDPEKIKDLVRSIEAILKDLRA